jgi:hypothetical protein
MGETIYSHAGFNSQELCMHRTTIAHVVPHSLQYVRENFARAPFCAREVSTPGRVIWRLLRFRVHNQSAQQYGFDRLPRQYGAVKL